MRAITSGWRCPRRPRTRHGSRPDAGLAPALVSATSATRLASTECRGKTGRLADRRAPSRAARRGTSRHIQRPLAGKRLNGESFQPCALKMGPRRKGCQRTSRPAARPSAMRAGRPAPSRGWPGRTRSRSRSALTRGQCAAPPPRRCKWTSGRHVHAASAPLTVSSPIPGALRATELRALVKLALPLALAQAGQALMGLVDTAVVGRAGAVQLAGAALGNAVVFTICIFGIGTLMGVDPLISQALGARRSAAGAPALLAGAPGGGGGEPVARAPDAGARRSARAARASRPTSRAASPGLRLLAAPGNLPRCCVFYAQRSYLAGASARPDALVWVTVLANVINLLGDLLLVFGGAQPAGVDRAAAVDSADGRRRARRWPPAWCRSARCRSSPGSSGRFPCPTRPADLHRRLPDDERRILRVGDAHRPSLRGRGGGVRAGRVPRRSAGRRQPRRAPDCPHRLLGDLHLRHGHRQRRQRAGRSRGRCPGHAGSTAGRAARLRRRGGLHGLRGAAPTSLFPAAASWH